MKTANETVRAVMLIGLAVLFVTGCATTGPKDDPLKYTKKLVAEGHASLYKNGAFQVPNTQVRLIPPGPDALEFAQELAGMRAKQSFEKSIRKAADSVYIVSEGTKLTYRVAKDISGKTNESADAIRQFSRENGMQIVYRSSDLGKSIIGKSWDLSKETFAAGQRQGEAIIAGSQSLGSAVSEKGTAQGLGLATGSFDAAKNLVASSSAAGDAVSEGGTKQGKELVSGSFHTAGSITKAGNAAGSRIIEKGTAQGLELASGSLHAAKDISAASLNRSGDALAYAGRTFVRGYAAVPSKMKKHAGAMGDSLTDAKFTGIIRETNETRKAWSKPSVDLMADTIKNYGANVSESFKKAGKELDASSTSGVSFAVLKSLRWVLQGILWDATIEPLGKMTAASVGYISVNYLAFPSMVVVREGVATTKLAIEVTWNSAKMGYDIVAPTGVAAVAGVYGVLDFTGSHAVAGATAVAGSAAGVGEAALSIPAGVAVKGGGLAVAGATAAAGTAAGTGEIILSKPAGVAVKGGGFVAAGATAVAGSVAGAGEVGLSQVSGVLIKGGGFVAGKGVQYIGVPLTSAGIAVGGGTIGTVVGGTGMTSGGALVVTGEVSGITAQVFGNTIAGVTLVGGTAVSASGGAAYGVYELSKAVVVPAGYELGSGIIVSYETLSQLTAQSVLAVSDCAYVVLSLEGPRWVLYAVKGKTHSGEDLPVGTVVDLKQMQGSGEEIKYLPVSDQEMKNVVESVYDNLPEVAGDKNEPSPAATEAQQ